MLYSEEIKLGQSINVSHKLVRTKTRRGEYTTGYNKIWELVTLPTPIEVIVVGHRTISNGYTEFELECGYIYTPTEYFKALLVTSSLNEKPYYVRLDQITIKQEPKQ